MAKKSTLVQLAEKASKNSGEIAIIINAAGLVVTAAAKLIEQAQPLMENVDTAAVATKAKAGMTTAAQNASKAGKAAANAAGGAADAVTGILEKLGDVKDGIFEDLAKAKSEKELRQTIKDARQTVLENATSTITIADLLKAQEKTGEGGIKPLSDMPGCFVITTYKKMDFDKDLTDYTGVYVGRADNIDEGLNLAISKDGNADVYADVKYKQNVHAYIYNCLPEDLEERYFSLSQTFAGEGSYN